MSINVSEREEHFASPSLGATAQPPLNNNCNGYNFNNVAWELKTHKGGLDCEVGPGNYPLSNCPINSDGEREGKRKKEKKRLDCRCMHKTPPDRELKHPRCQDFSMNTVQLWCGNSIVAGTEVQCMSTSVSTERGTEVWLRTDC